MQLATLLLPRRLSGPGGACCFARSPTAASPTRAGGKLLWARIKLARGDLGGALRALLEAEAMNPQIAWRLHPDRRHLCSVCCSGRTQKSPTKKRSLWTRITRALSRALDGLSSARATTSRRSIMRLRAVSLLHRLPLAHFNLGVALVRSGDNERGAAGLRNRASLSTEMVNAHRYLATIHQDGRRRSGKGALSSRRSYCV